MPKLSPREEFNNELPEPVKAVHIRNHTLASLDFDAEIEGTSLVIELKVISLGPPQEAQVPQEKKHWKLG